MCVQQRFVTGVEFMRRDAWKTVGRGDAGGSPWQSIGEIYFVGTRLGEQSGDESPDFASTQNQYPLHEPYLRRRGALVCN